MNLKPGTYIDHYIIIKLIGRGGMAEVYQTRDSRLDAIVALKFIRADRFAPEILRWVVKRFQIEAKKMAQLSHPNIVKVFDYGTYQGMPYLVMDYLPGGTLKQSMGRPMGYKAAARLLLPIAEALTYAHSKGVIHRDVKPGNILISENGQSMLSDFGVAKVMEGGETQGLTATGASIGTAEYMAPEQAVGKKVDQRADIYSLGIIFYELLTGRRPFTADTPMEILVKQIHEPAPSPSQYIKGLPKEVEQVLVQALAKEPDGRYANMGTFAGKLHALTQEQTKKPGKVKQKEPVARNRNKRHPALPKSPDKKSLSIAVYLAVGVLFISIGWWAMRNLSGSIFPRVMSISPETHTATPVRTQTPIIKPTPTFEPTPVIVVGKLVYGNDFETKKLGQLNLFVRKNGIISKPTTDLSNNEYRFSSYEHDSTYLRINANNPLTDYVTSFL